MISRKDLKSAATRQAVYRKVSAIQGEDGVKTLSFGKMNQCRIRELGIQSTVAPHEMSKPRHRRFIKRQKPEQTAVETKQQFLYRRRIISEQPRPFDQDGPARQ